MSLFPEIEREIMKEKYNSLDLWKFFRKKCIEYYPEMHFLPKRPMVRILAILKKMLKEYDVDTCEKYIEICIRDWEKFRKKYKVKDRYPQIVTIFYFRTRELIEAISAECIAIDSNVFRTKNEDRKEELDEWIGE